ncbi:hypothetical protein M2480_003132 [Parabacteroides sp. PFB2-12]|uniref:hypothetical protein n=1 Tax=unclassified Parabacteroides TaxID=2649774 RepID=UPI002476805E|nr:MULTISPECIES: hypothetical protein [unclassified Parabacteroides]MDH6344217.1 hypothetical protein [Parabacteroides sp. PM6-13]MDH6392124.1 hypothetical protein [Parabacteroides sp. PFB2-12]
MKLRNFLSILLCTGMFFSCAQEELIELATKVGTGEEVLLNLSLKPEEVESTKSTYTEDGVEYFYATDAEKRINHCLLVVFEYVEDATESNEDKKYKVYFSQEYSFGENDHEDYVYTLDPVEAKLGKSKFLVIANPTKTFTALKGVTTYADFKKAEYVEENKKEGNYSPVFTASELVKVGEKTLDLTIANKDEIIIPLTQLAARVDITFSFNVKELADATTTTQLAVYDGFVAEIFDNPATVEAYGEAQNNHEKIIPIEIKDLQGGTITIGSKYQHLINKQGDPFYSYYWNNNLLRDKTSNPHGLVIGNTLYEINTKTSGWIATVSDFAIYNIETKSDLLLDYKRNATTDRINKIYELRSDETISPTRLADGSYYFSFYTYEREYIVPQSAEAEKMLHITFQVAWKKGVMEYKQLAFPKEGSEKAMYAVCLDKKGGPTSGNNYVKLGYIYLKDEALPQMKDLDLYGDISIVDETIEVRRDVKYKIEINPKYEAGTKKRTDGLIHGNIYVLSASLNSLPSVSQEVTLDWLVNPWVREPEVNIGFN